MIFSTLIPLDTVLGSIFINWDRNLFEIPFIHHPVTWYGLLFAFSFFVGYFLTKFIIRKYLETKSFKPEFARKESLIFTERLTLYVIVGAIVGARLGHVFFYDWLYYKHHLLDIFKLWEGGLASHGAVLGIMIAMALFVLLQKKNFSFLSFFVLLDTLVIPACFAGGCIRIGNFINQEILGKPTTLPWGVIFGHPTQKVENVPLHPVQIYESLVYFILFIFLLWIWKLRKYKIGDGINSALFFIFVFSFRFLIEFLKYPQGDFFDEKHVLNMGQLLSLPFILFGVILLLYHYKKGKKI